MPFEVGIVTVKNKDKKYTITWFHCSKSLWLVAKWLCAQCGPWRLQLGLSSASSLPYGAGAERGWTLKGWSKTIYQIYPNLIAGYSNDWRHGFNHSVANLKSQVVFRGILCKVIPLVGFGWHHLVTTADGRNAASACRQDAVNPAQITFNWARFQRLTVSTLSVNTHTMFQLS